MQIRETDIGDKDIVDGVCAYMHLKIKRNKKQKILVYGVLGYQIAQTLLIILTYSERIPFTNRKKVLERLHKSRNQSLCKNNILKKNNLYNNYYKLSIFIKK